LVEGANHVVAIAPRVWTVVVVLESARVGVARHIEPVSAPPLSVVRRGQQRIDQSLPRARSGVSEERCGLGGSRRASGPIQIRAPQQREPRRARRGREALVLPRLFEETIDWMLEAGGNLRNR